MDDLTILYRVLWIGLIPVFLLLIYTLWRVVGVLKRSDQLIEQTSQDIHPILLDVHGTVRNVERLSHMTVDRIQSVGSGVDKIQNKGQSLVNTAMSMLEVAGGSVKFRTGVFVGRKLLNLVLGSKKK